MARARVSFMGHTVLFTHSFDGKLQYLLYTVNNGLIGQSIYGTGMFVDLRVISAVNWRDKRLVNRQ